MKLLSTNRAFAIFLPIFAATGPRVATAATAKLLPEADTYIRDTVPGSNFGAANPILVGISALGSPRQRCLFKFTLVGIPSDAVINGATLQLIAVAGQREPFDFELNRLLVDWTEGSATWLLRLSGTPWSAPGASSGTDYVAAPSATAAMSPVPVGSLPVTNSYSSPGMVADLQLWLNNPAANFGWILHVAGNQAGSGRQLASREDASLKPVLTVEYTVSEAPGPATPPTLFSTALEAGAIRFAFNAESNHTYTVEFRDALTSNTWTLLKNIPAQSADTTVHVTNTISSGERYFRARTP